MEEKQSWSQKQNSRHTDKEKIKIKYGLENKGSIEPDRCLGWIGLSVLQISGSQFEAKITKSGNATKGWLAEGWRWLLGEQHEGRNTLHMLRTLQLPWSLQLPQDMGATYRQGSLQTFVIGKNGEPPSKNTSNSCHSYTLYGPRSSLIHLSLLCAYMYICHVGHIIMPNPYSPQPFSFSLLRLPLSLLAVLERIISTCL